MQANLHMQQKRCPFWEQAETRGAQHMGAMLNHGQMSMHTQVLNAPTTQLESIIKKLVEDR
jgi:hypothetical protein